MPKRKPQPNYKAALRRAIRALRVYSINSLALKSAAIEALREIEEILEGKK